MHVSFSISQTQVSNLPDEWRGNRNAAPVTFHFQHSGEDEGLLQHTINSILQDRQGFLWLGTDEELVRSDGYRFRTFAHTIDDSTSLSHNHVNGLFEESLNRLWIGTSDGLNGFNPRTETFISILTTPDRYGKTARDDISAIYEDGSGAIWTASILGLCRIESIPD